MTDPFAPVEAALATARQQEAALEAAAVKAQADADAVKLAADEATIAALRAQLAKQQPVPTPTPPPPPSGIAWGVNASTPKELAAREAALGPVRVVRYFQQPGEGITAAAEMNFGARQFIYSPQVSIPEQAAGKWDAQWLAMMRACPTDRHTYVTVQHEPESHVKAGEYTPAQYVAAFQHVATLARQVGPHIRMTSILMGYTLMPQSGRNWHDYYPGDTATDVLAWDVYSETPTWPYPPANLYDAVYAASQSVGKPWAIAETGVDHASRPAAQVTADLTTMSKALSQYPTKPVFVCYFDTNAPPDWTITTRPADVAAWKAGQTA